MPADALIAIIRGRVLADAAVASEVAHLMGALPAGGHPAHGICALTPEFPLEGGAIDAVFETVLLDRGARLDDDAAVAHWVSTVEAQGARLTVEAVESFAPARHRLHTEVGEWARGRCAPETIAAHPHEWAEIQAWDRIPLEAGRHRVLGFQKPETIGPWRTIRPGEGQWGGDCAILWLLYGEIEAVALASDAQLTGQNNPTEAWWFWATEGGVTAARRDALRTESHKDLGASLKFARNPHERAAVEAELAERQRIRKTLWRLGRSRDYPALMRLRVANPAQAEALLSAIQEKP